MPQIANQDYNFIDFNVLPNYEAIERLYRAYLNGTALDCVVKQGNAVDKIISYDEATPAGTTVLEFNSKLTPIRYVIKAPLVVDSNGFLKFKNDAHIVSADGFKLKAVVKDGVLTGVEVTAEKVENDALAQDFKDGMSGQPVTP